MLAVNTIESGTTIELNSHFSKQEQKEEKKESL
ncbi:hypothetical protein A2U01_0052309, partial [Trifolium medium]|nr:hypothetical protein [Trifolium medium]